ncbi:MAG TPA: PilZ domain-containing protein [Thermoleophilaceae bacterium]|nr:PilZ domain-containing protein [Thermoleophilaceae bacterium]
MKKLFGKSQAAGPTSNTVTVDQRVDIKIRGLGRTGGTVEEITSEFVIVGLIVDPATAPGHGGAGDTDAIIEFTGLRGLYRQKGAARFDLSNGKKVRFISDQEPELVQRREFVRVPVNVTVNVTLKSGGWPLECDALNLSGNGVLLEKPQSGKALDIGTLVWLSISLHDGQAPITPRGTVVRDAKKGARGVRFDHIGERDQERLVRFVMREERRQRKNGAL